MFALVDLPPFFPTLVEGISAFLQRTPPSIVATLLVCIVTALALVTCGFLLTLRARRLPTVTEPVSVTPQAPQTPQSQVRTPVTNAGPDEPYDWEHQGI